MRKHITIISLILFSIGIHAQEWKADWSASFRAGVEYADVKGFFFELDANFAGALSQKSPVNPGSAYAFVDPL